MATSPSRFARIFVGPWFWAVFWLIFALVILLNFLGKQIAAKPPPLDEDWSQ
jgi:hypothetical protein